MKLASVLLLILISGPAVAQVPTSEAIHAQADVHARVDDAVWGSRPLAKYVPSDSLELEG